MPVWILLDSTSRMETIKYSISSNLQTHGETLDTLKEALSARPNKSCAILLDTKGPEIRTGLLRDNEEVDFVAGQEIDILTDYTLEGDNTRLTCNYKSLATTVKPGDVILIADGALSCEVKECFDDASGGYVKVECKNDARIGERKNMNLPGCTVDLPTLTEDD
jgi:pyruvate kinase